MLTKTAMLLRLSFRLCQWRRVQPLATKACARRDACVWVDETVVRTHRVRGVQAPEYGGGDISGFPWDRFPIGHKSAFRSEPFAGGDAPDHLTAASIVRLTTVSRT